MHVGLASPIREQIKEKTKSVIREPGHSFLLKHQMTKKKKKTLVNKKKLNICYI